MRPCGQNFLKSGFLQAVLAYIQFIVEKNAHLSESFSIFSLLPYWWRQINGLSIKQFRSSTVVDSHTKWQLQFNLFVTNDLVDCNSFYYLNNLSK